jgi:hypothetical protein
MLLIDSQRDDADPLTAIVRLSILFFERHEETFIAQTLIS